MVLPEEVARYDTIGVRCHDWCQRADKGQAVPKQTPFQNGMGFVLCDITIIIIMGVLLEHHRL